MSEPNLCPSCGHDNPPGAAVCAACNFPITGIPAAPESPESESTGPEPAPVPAPSEPEPEPQPAEPAATEPPASDEVPPARAFDPNARPFRPIRPRPPRPASPIQMQLWLIVGAAAAVLVLFTAFRGFKDNNFPAVEGAKQDQQKVADAAREMLARDSTHLEARIALADVLYDTGNWSEAVIHYKSAARVDSLRVATWVDLGVCYYNLGQARLAEDRFEHALRLDPHHPVALFNLGIVHEQREEHEQALDFYHRAMSASPPENMREPLVTRMKEVMTKLGRTAPALDPAKLPAGR